MALMENISNHQGFQISPQPSLNAVQYLDSHCQNPEQVRKSLFPQIHSLVREIVRARVRIFQKQQRRLEEMLRAREPLNWSTGTRTDRPLEVPARPRIVLCAHEQEIRRHQRVLQSQSQRPPTQYYTEQLLLARQPTNPQQLLNQPPVEVRRGVIERFVIALVTSYIKPLLDFGVIVTTTSLAGLLKLGLIVIVWGMIKPARILYDLVAAMDWQAVLMTLLAAQFARWLPRTERGLGSWEDVGGMWKTTDRSLYIIYVPGNAAIGTGSSFGNMV